jgi:hypothetical protein
VPTITGVADKASGRSAIKRQNGFSSVAIPTSKSDVSQGAVPPQHSNPLNSQFFGTNADLERSFLMALLKTENDAALIEAISKGVSMQRLIVRYRCSASHIRARLKMLGAPLPPPPKRLPYAERMHHLSGRSQ